MAVRSVGQSGDPDVGVGELVTSLGWALSPYVYVLVPITAPAVSFVVTDWSRSVRVAPLV